MQCEWGINRSATIATAYLMRHERLPLRDALKLLQARRSCTRPRDMYIEQLRALERQWLPELADDARLSMDEVPVRLRRDVVSFDARAHAHARLA